MKLQLRSFPGSVEWSFFAAGRTNPQPIQDCNSPNMTVGKTKGFRLGKNCAVKIRNLALHLGLPVCAGPRWETANLEGGINKRETIERYREVETFHRSVNPIRATDSGLPVHSYGGSFTGIQ
jgi:hypothetical protein